MRTHSSLRSGCDQVDMLSFSLGGMVAQALVTEHPQLVRKLILTGTGPAGGQDMDKVAGVTYGDIARAALSRKEPKEFLFFNRNSTGKPARPRASSTTSGNAPWYATRR